MSIWQILDIEPTDDQAAIRRAYARRLKQFRPDADPEGYQRLREAFEQAKSGVSHDFTSFISLDDRLAWPQAPEQTEAADGALVQPAAFSDGVPVYHPERIAQLAAQLVETEMVGFAELDALWQSVCREGNLLQQQLFHRQLAAALAQQPELNDAILHRISLHLGWQLEEYGANHVIPDDIQQALDQRIRQTEVDRGWKLLQLDAGQGKVVDRLALKLLTGSRSEVSFWIRLVPGLIEKIVVRVNDVQRDYPELRERLNPAFLHFVRTQRMGLNPAGLFLMVFWGFLLSVAVPMSDAAPLPATLVCVLVAFYLFIHGALLLGLSRWKTLQACYLLLEFVLSIAAALALFGGLSFILVVEAPDSSQPTFLLSLGGGLLLLALLWHSWPGHQPWLMRPGMMMARVAATPWTLIKTLAFSYPAIICSVIYFVLCFASIFQLLRLPLHWR